MSQWAGAADLPPELFECILAYLSPYDRLTGIIASKRELGKLSLVCRYWARQCRPLMFNMNPTLECLGDVQRLCRLVHASVQLSPDVRNCLKQINTKYEGVWTYFWHHLTASGLRHSVATLQNVHVSEPSADSRSGGGHAPRSWSTGLPRTLPSTLVYMSQLHLTDLRFRHVGDFAHLLLEISGLTDVECTRLRFDDPEYSLPFPTLIHRRSYRGKHWRVEVCDCGSPATSTNILLSAVAFSPANGAPAYCLGPMHWASLRNAVQVHIPFNTSRFALVLASGDLDHGRGFRLEITGHNLKSYDELFGLRFECSAAAPLRLRMPGTASLTTLMLRLGYASIWNGDIPMHFRALADLAATLDPLINFRLVAWCDWRVFIQCAELFVRSRSGPLGQRFDRNKFHLCLSVSATRTAMELSHIIQAPSHNPAFDVRGILELEICAHGLEGRLRDAIRDAYLAAADAESRRLGEPRARGTEERERWFLRFLWSPKFRRLRLNGSEDWYAGHYRSKVHAYERRVLWPDYKVQDSHFFVTGQDKLLQWGDDPQSHPEVPRANIALKASKSESSLAATARGVTASTQDLPRRRRASSITPLKYLAPKEQPSI